MRITDVKLRLLSGAMPVEAEFWEQRLSRPLDIYPEHKAAEQLNRILLRSQRAGVARHRPLQDEEFLTIAWEEGAVSCE